MVRQLSGSFHDECVDGHAAVSTAVFRVDAHVDEVETEDGSEDMADRPAEGRCDCFGSIERHPIACFLSDTEQCIGKEGMVPCAAIAPPVMLWQISRSPGLAFNILAGVVLCC